MNIMRKREPGKYEEYEGDYINYDFIGDDDCMRRVRDEVKRLPLPERKIFLLYLEVGSFTEVAKELHCSVPTASHKVKAIRDKIKKASEDICMDY